MFPVRFMLLSVRCEHKSISTVKQKCISKHRTTTLYWLKISSPKARDDPSGSSSPRIASDFPDRSNFGVVKPVSLVITSSESRHKLFGSLLPRVASDVLLIPWLFLELDVMLIHGSLLKPHESCYASCSWCRFSELQMDMSVDGCCFLLIRLHSVKISSYISEHMRIIERSFPLLIILNSFRIWFVLLLSRMHKEMFLSSSWLICHERHASSRYVSRQGEILPSRINSLATVIHEDDCGFVGKGLCFTQGIFGWLKCSLIFMFACGKIKIYVDKVFALNATHKLLWQQSLPPIFLQGQSRDYCFIEPMIVARSGWFIFILELFYCSLPRPPEDLSDFG